MKDRFDGLVDHLLNTGISLDEAVGLLEKGMIQDALSRSEGNQCAAARLLDVHRNTLQRKMAEHGLATARGRAGRKPMARAAAQSRKRKTGAA
jgi:DNA-binding NtrC family response regulator